MAAVLANGGGFYHPFAYVAEALRMGLAVLPPDVNASDIRCTGRDGALRIGLQFVKGLSADGATRLLAARPFISLFDLRARTGLVPSDLRALIKVGALDSIAGDWTRPMMLWLVDAKKGAEDAEVSLSLQSLSVPQSGLSTACPSSAPSASSAPSPSVPRLKDYPLERRRREEFAALGFVTDTHPMQLHAESLARFRLCPSTDLHRHVGQHILAAGMLTTAKPVHTLKDEPMQFATFDDGGGLIETVLFPQVFRERGHVLFDQGPFIFRGKVEEEFGVVTLTITHLERLERAVHRKTPLTPAARSPASAP
jgi:DNA polymerase III alpha subunit